MHVVHRTYMRDGCEFLCARHRLRRADGDIVVGQPAYLVILHAVKRAVSGQVFFVVPGAVQLFNIAIVVSDKPRQRLIYTPVILPTVPRQLIGVFAVIG